MPCFFFFHKYVPYLEKRALYSISRDNNGKCILRHRCDRCGKVIEEPTQQPHDFASSTKYRCEGTGTKQNHKCTKVEEFTCKACGYTRYEYTVVFEYEIYNPGNGCKSDRPCPGCGKRFPFEIAKHIFEKTGNYTSHDSGCLIEVKCEQCGFKSSEGRLSHDFGHPKEISKCESAQTCKRCGKIQLEDHHDWKVIRTFNEENWDNYIRSWDEEVKCQKCGKTNIRRSSDWNS